MNGSTGGAFPHLVGGGWYSSSSRTTPIGATAESGLVAALGDLNFELSGILCERVELESGLSVLPTVPSILLSLHLCLAESDLSEHFARNFLAIVLELAVSLLLGSLEAVSLVLAAHLAPLGGFAPAPAVPDLLQLTIGSSGIEICGRFLPRSGLSCRTSMIGPYAFSS